MRLSTHLFILFIFCFHIVYAQNDLSNKQRIDEEYEKLKRPNTDEDVKKLTALIEASEKINYKEGIIKGKFKILPVLYNRADYKKTLEVINEIETLGIKDNRQISSLFNHKSYVNRALGIKKEEYQNIQNALKYAKKIEDPDQRHLSSSYAYNNFSAYYDYKSADSLIYYLKKELEELQQIDDNNEDLKVDKYNGIVLNNMNIGNFYLGVIQPQRLDLAEPYYLTAYEYRNKYPSINEKHSLPILCGVGRFYMEKGEYEKSIELANEVLEIEKHKKNTPYRLYAYMLLADCHKGLKNSEKQAEYTLLYANLNDSINKAAKEEVGQQFDNLVTEVEKKKEKEYSSNLKVILASAGCFVLVLTLLVILYWKRRNKIIRQKYEALIEQIKSEKTVEENQLETSEVQKPKTPLIITDDTLKFLLVKLEKFEKSKLFLRKDMSRPWLATHLNTNTKYLTEVIKVHSGTTFTDYIHKLRINYIIRKLVDDPKYREYKIEYLADESGYGSRQVFITAFKGETGFTPSYFIDNLKKDGLENRE